MVVLSVTLSNYYILQTRAYTLYVFQRLILPIFYAIVPPQF